MVEGGLYCRDGFTAKQEIRLPGARVGGDLQLRQSTIDAAVDLTGARIAGELHLAISDDTNPTWGPDARLKLRNAEAGAIAGSIDALMHKPEKGKPQSVRCDLAGFRYAQLGGLGAEPGATLADAPVGRLRRLLGARLKDSRHFDGGPYAQLAHALAAAGWRAKATKIRIAARNRELFARGTPILRKISLFFSSLFTGYGYLPWRAAAWFVAGILAGVWFGMVRAGASWTDIDALTRWFWYSADTAFPIIQLDAGHDDFLADQLGGSEAADIPVGVASFYNGLKLFGLVSLTYLAAGVTGFAAGSDRADRR